LCEPQIFIGSGSVGMPRIETSWGDVVDRQTISELKVKNIDDPVRKGHAETELQALRACMPKVLPEKRQVRLDALASRLREINAHLWDVEELLRKHELADDFGAGFVELARSVYMLNDRRARLKTDISGLLGSRLMEVKSHVPLRDFDHGGDTAGTLVLGHLGLGDQLITFPIVVALIAYGKAPIVVACRQHETTMRDLYGRLASEVDFLWVDRTEDISPAFGADPSVLDGLRSVGLSVLSLGLHAGVSHMPPRPFWTVFYEQTRIPASAIMPAYRTFAGPRRRDAEIALLTEAAPPGPYVVVHEDPERNMVLDRSKLRADLPIVVVPGRWRKNSLFDFCALIENSREFHGFDSCFAWLVHLMQLDGPDRFLHAYVKSDHDAVRLFAGLQPSPKWTDVW